MLVIVSVIVIVIMIVIVFMDRRASMLEWSNGGGGTDAATFAHKDGRIDGGGTD